MWTINGIGTKLCGKKNIANDGTYQSTKWIVIFNMPIIPLKTYRVMEIQTFDLNSAEKNMLIDYKMEPIKFDINQVVKTFLSYWIGVFATITFLVLLHSYDFPTLYFLMAIGLIYMIYEIFFMKK